VGKQLDWHNSQLFQGRDYSRRDLFEQEERAFLRSLPSQPYQIQHVVLAKVQRNYHIILGEDRHQYSVPFTLIGKTLKVIYNPETVEVYQGLQRVAIHRRDARAHSYTTVAEHMPANHRYWEERQGWTPDYFTDKARASTPRCTPPHCIHGRCRISTPQPRQNLTLPAFRQTPIPGYPPTTQLLAVPKPVQRPYPAPDGLRVD